MIEAEGDETEELEAHTPVDKTTGLPLTAVDGKTGLPMIPPEGLDLKDPLTGKYY